MLTCGVVSVCRAFVRAPQHLVASMPSIPAREPPRPSTVCVAALHACGSTAVGEQRRDAALGLVEDGLRSRASSQRCSSCPEAAPHSRRAHHWVSHSLVPLIDDQAGHRSEGRRQIRFRTWEILGYTAKSPRLPAPLWHRPRGT